MPEAKPVLAKDGDVVEDLGDGKKKLKPEKGAFKFETEKEFLEKKQALSDAGYTIIPQKTKKSGSKEFISMKASKQLTPDTVREVEFGWFKTSG